MTTVAFKALTLAEQIFYDLVWHPGIRAGELALEGSVPFFALPVIRNVEEEVIDLLSDYLFRQFATFVDVSAIRLVNTKHQREFDLAATKLKILAHSKGIDSPEFKQAREDAKIVLSQFVRFSPTAS